MALEWASWGWRRWVYGPNQNGLLLPGGGAPAGPRILLQADLNASGVSNLDRDIELNNVTVSPTLWYEAKDISGTTWTAVAGNDLEEAGSGTSPTSGRAAPFTDDTEAVKYAPGTNKVHADGTDTTTGNVSTKDFVFETLVYTRPSSSGTQFVTMKQSTAGVAGWSLFCFSGGDYRFQLHDGTTNTVLISSSMSPAWNHFLVVADRSGSMRLYVNGEVTDTEVISSVGDVDNAIAFSVGGRSVGQSVCQSDVAHVALWQRADWLDTHEQDEWAAARHAQLVGTYPSLFGGTPTPVFTRATDAYVDIRSPGGVVSYHRVGKNWARIARRADTSLSNEAGYLSERQATNEFDYSHDFSSWTANNGSVTTGAIASPEPGHSADAFVASTATFGHYLEDTPTVFANTTYVMSVFVKDGASFGWLNIDFNNNKAGAYFNVNAGTTPASDYQDASNIIHDHGITDIGGGWYRCWVIWEPTYSGAPQVRIRAAEKNNDHSFAGDGSTVNFYAWGAQLEEAIADTEAPSSLIQTNGSATTRNGDVLYYIADDGNYSESEGYVQVEQMLPDIDLSGGDLRHFVTAYSASRYMTLYGQASLDRGRLSSDATTGFNVQGDSSHDAADGDMHTWRYTYAINSAILYRDAASSGTPDTTGTPPTGITKIGVGIDETETSQPNGLMRGLVTYSAPEAP